MLDLALDLAGRVGIGDTLNHRIRKVDAATGDIATYGGTGTLGYTGDGGAATLAMMYEPRGVSVNASGDVYLADSKNHVIRKITAATGVITLVAGRPGTTGSATACSPPAPTSRIRWTSPSIPLATFTSRAKKSAASAR